MNKKALALSVAAAISFSTSAIGDVTYDAETEWVVMKGSISSDSVEAVKNMINRTGSKGLVIVSDGGLIFEAIELGRFLRINGITTIAPDRCASACTHVFAGGVERVVTYDTRMGVHSFSTPSEQMAKLNKSEVEQTAQTVAVVTSMYFNTMGVDNEMNLLASTIPPDEMHYISIGEMKRWNLATVVFEEKDQISRTESNTPVYTPSPVHAPTRETPVVAYVPKPSPVYVPPPVKETVPVKSEMPEVNQYGWKWTKNVAVPEEKNEYTDSWGIRYLHYVDAAEMVVCSTRPEAQSLRDVQVRIKVDGDLNVVKDGMRAERARSCWDIPLTEKELLIIKNGNAGWVNFNNVVGIYSSLDGIALNMNKAWAYTEHRRIVRASK